MVGIGGGQTPVRFWSNASQTLVKLQDPPLGKMMVMVVVVGGGGAWEMADL